MPGQLQHEYISKGRTIPDLIQRAQIDNDLTGTQEYMKSFSYPPNVSFRSVDEILCKNNTCRTTVGPNLATDLVVWDYGHVTESGALFLSKIIFKDIEDLISD
ncbi:unannotated protein [freshwater metagenome]|uniref:Unannotated protein n=1 Tax=freshwater metagenome TaxID=449393 RepID=A0A6J7P218_9ZZZZ